LASSDTAPFVFVSHATADPRDLRLAHLIADTVSERGAQAWIAPDSIPPGEEWLPHIEAALRRCTHFLVILSTAASQSEWVAKEVSLARDRYAGDPSLRVLCLRIGRVPDSADIEFLSRFQQVPYEDNPDVQTQIVAMSVGLGEAVPAPVESYLMAVRDYCARSSYLTLQALRAPAPRSDTYVPLWVEQDGDDGSNRSTSQHETRMSIADMMSADRDGHLLVVGEPGSGKSTLLRRLAERGWDVPQAAGLSRRHLPLIAPLRRLAEADGTISERLRAVLTKELTLSAPLPDDFIEKWAGQTGSPWLILLDAFDEVTDSERARLANWLEGALPALDKHRVVIASRASAIRGDSWEARFTRHRLLPFTAEQTSAFAANWFDEDGASFLRELQRLRVVGSGATVLLLTIAARVFLLKRRLPDRRAQLYRECVEDCLEEAHLLGADQELGELRGPADLQAARLAGLALRMSEDPTSGRLDRLVEFISDYLIKEENVPKGKARGLGRQFIEVMARRSGLLVRREDVYEMVHPTFREFLAAYAIATTWNPDDPEATAYVDRWARFDWQDVVLFAFSVWNDTNKNVTLALQRQVEAEDGLRLAGALLAEGVLVAPALESRIVDRLLVAARTEWFDRHDRFNTFRVLARLADRPQVTHGLEDLARDDTLGDETRLAALGSLRSHDRANEIGKLVATILGAKPPEFWDSDRSGFLLRRVGDAGLLDRVIDNDRLAIDVRLHAAMKRVEWAWDYGPPDRAIAAIASLASSSEVNPSIRLEALGLIEQSGSTGAPIPGLRSIVNDKGSPTSTRLLAARRLRDAGAADEGDAALLAVVYDPFAPPGLRRSAAFDLGTQSYKENMTPADISRLLGYAVDKRLPINARYVAADTARHETGTGGELDDLLAIAGDRSADKQRRTAAILALGFRGGDPRVAEIASTLEALVHDATDEGTWPALDSLALLNRPHRPVTKRLAEMFREQAAAPMAVLAEEVGEVLGDEQCLALLLRVPQLFSEDLPPFGDPAEPMRGFARMRRDESEVLFRKLLLGARPAPGPLLLFAATSLSTEPEIRTVARACAFRSMIGGPRIEEIVSRLNDPDTPKDIAEVLVWYLRYTADEAGAAALDRIARDEAVSGQVRAVAIESLAVLGRDDQAADLLVLAGGGTLPRKAPPSHADISMEHEHRFLAEMAWSSGFPELSPVLMSASMSLGVEGVKTVLVRFAAGTESRSSAGT
jgi:hypothetical protein